MADFKNLTKKEIDKFFKENQYGILSMAGDKPYAIPMGYGYKRKTVLMSLSTESSMITQDRKMKYLKKSKNICFTICKPRWFVPKLKNPCTTLVIEGTLEEVKNRSYYGLPKVVSSKIKMNLYKIKVSKMGARKCNRKPCELFVDKK